MKDKFDKAINDLRLAALQKAYISPDLKEIKNKFIDISKKRNLCTNL